MPVLTSLDAAVGNTPLVEVRSLSRATGCTILGKCEFLNPGGSVKDRAARAMLDQALARGDLQRGGTVVEATAGNTGIGLAWLARTRGVAAKLFLPASVCPEKVQLLRALGADVRLCAEDDPESAGYYVAEARRWAAATPGAWFADQFDNEANWRAHAATTAPEILLQCGTAPYAVVAAVGSGGTLGGLTQGFASAGATVRCICADPHGTPAAAWRGERPAPAPHSVLEGVGQHRRTANLARARIDGCWRVPDAATLSLLRHVLVEDGLFLGGTAALNLCGAVLEAWRSGPGRVIVAVLCDGGARYVSRLHDTAWLESAGLRPPAQPWDLLREQLA
jgi:cysteine synthase A